MPLCVLCQRVSPLIIKTIRKFEDVIGSDVDRFSLHQRSFTGLEQSSMNCQLCRLFYNEILRRKQGPLRFDAPVVLASYYHWDLDPEVHGPQLHHLKLKCGKRLAELHALAPLDSEAASSGAVAGRPLLDRNSQESFNMVRTWMKDCVENHMACSRGAETRSELTNLESGQLPPRVLDVKAFAGVTLDIRLVEPADLEGQYVALSHRWSMDPSKHFKTTKSSIEEHKRRIVLEMMPATFQDAVKTTRELGLSYLWIDSLCIIQDDPEDWMRQSVMMGDIYHRATITIMAATTPRALASAVPAQSCEGFLHRNWAPDLPTVELPYHSPDGKASGNWYIQACRVDQQDWELITRGWVLQGMVLSRRKIIYSPDQIIWKYLETSFKPRKFRNLRQQDRYFLQEWYSHIETYSNCQLKFECDKLPALSGLASYFSRRHKQEYHAGIFSNGIAEGLLWAPEHPGTLTRPKTTSYLAPSWSWASANGPIKFKAHPSLEAMDATSGSSVRSNSAVGNVIFRLTPLGNHDPYGQLQDGTMELIAILKSAWMRRAREDDIFAKVSTGGPEDELLMVLHDDSGRLLCTFNIDFVDSAPAVSTREMVDFMYVLKDEKHGLVLRKVEGMERTYQRIAYATLDPEWFENAEGGSRKEYIAII